MDEWGSGNHRRGVKSWYVMLDIPYGHSAEGPAGGILDCLEQNVHSADVLAEVIEGSMVKPFFSAIRF